MVFLCFFAKAKIPEAHRASSS